VNLWRLELIRLLRTHRWLILFGVYGFFGVIGPFTAAYMEEIVTRFGGEIEMTVPEPQPLDGIAQFVSNASQLGLLAVVVVAAGALALDAKPELAAFYRTRVERASWLIVPRYSVITVASIAALFTGTTIAWALTGVLIGGLPAGTLVVGTVYGGLYLAFAVAVLALMVGLTRSTVGAIFGAFAVLIALPLIALVPAIAPWLPSELFAAVVEMLAGAPASDFARSAAVTVGGTAALLVLAGQRYERREV
jgi:ABC-2 type transport system permease protein